MCTQLHHYRGKIAVVKTLANPYFSSWHIQENCSAQLRLIG